MGMASVRMREIRIARVSLLFEFVGLGFGGRTCSFGAEVPGASPSSSCEDLSPASCRSTSGKLTPPKVV